MLCKILIKLVDLKRKIRASRAFYGSHLEPMQNMVKLHKASSTAALEEISVLASSNTISIKEIRNDGFVPLLMCFSVYIIMINAVVRLKISLFPSAIQFLDAEVNFLFDELQSTVNSPRRNDTFWLANFVRDFMIVQSIWRISLRSFKDFFYKLMEESTKLERHTSTVDEIQAEFIFEFEAPYEEQSRAEAEKLIADMTTFVSNHLHRQKELVTIFQVWRYGHSYVCSSKSC